MNRFRLLALILVTTTALVLTAAARPERRYTAHPNAAREVHRIQAHFDSVVVELAAAATPLTLNESQRTRRTALTATLRAYRDRGVFPHNYEFPGRAVPYFVDSRTGTLCAVAHLLASTGRRDIVERVAWTDNNAWVSQLAGDTAFSAWLTANGITLAEAARIQVPYMIDSPTPEQRSRNAVFAIVGPLAIGGTVMSSILNTHDNADGHSRAANVVGFVSGLATAGMGFVSAGKPGVPMVASAAGAVLGSVGLALSTRAMHRHNVLASEAEAARAHRAVETSVAPFVGTGRDVGAGVAVTVRF
ncbi:MAG: hypothetical protein JWN53_1042 [Gemmatimonadetes bacterium]|nr:hypothetical protein [Gemmatimonadota bacterium]